MPFLSFPLAFARFRLLVVMGRCVLRLARRVIEFFKTRKM
ncbi:hypothetical protein L284_14145 [Novosphingobium lindaniclasticum LE124]|uniref:Uncharacterized protein n=1 Tax=Novosphingobium lindaniclasticum LE124 TaxID=1096930 RepID=T0IP52_9SPHN|nr:hypothetical protein L284_14145 [Novosphingobium lindaniclasticum LE124]